MGCYPISQLREPYSAISFLAQRIPLQNILNLKHPEIDSLEQGNDVKWSAYDICEGQFVSKMLT